MTQFSYTEPKLLVKPTESRVDAYMAHRTEGQAPLEKRFAMMFANQLHLTAESMLRRDIIDPMKYDDVVPDLQKEMVAHIKDFSAVAEQICAAIRTGKTIGISADYDADGNTSLALIIRLLRQCGVPPEKIIQHIPNRDQDGYGINEGAVKDFMTHHVDVMITLDNGTRAEKPIKKALDAGMEVIVIDHHGDAGGKTLPELAKVVNPNIAANACAIAQSSMLEETKNLAAVGVSYMMAAEVMARMNVTRAADAQLNPKPLLGLVALGTVSDVVPMGWLNRTLVREGLSGIRQGQDKNILRFMRGAGILNPTRISESEIAFRLGPIINAPGRLGDSVAWAFLSAMQEDKGAPALEQGINQTVKELQFSAEKLKPDAQKRKEANLETWRNANPDKIRSKEKEHAMLYDSIPDVPYLERLIESSVACNELRKDIEHLMRPEIRAESKKQADKLVRVIAGQGWHEGVIGIAASRVKEECGVPALVGSIKQREDSTWQAKFSARSIRVPFYPVDIGAAFGALGPQHPDDTSSLLAKAGGHPMAGGATIYATTREELDNKITQLSDALNERLGPDIMRAIAHRRENIFGTLDMSDAKISAQKAGVSLADRLNMLLDVIPHASPYGEATRAPLVAVRGVSIYSPQTGRGESRRGHLNFDIMDDDGALRIHCRASNAGGTMLAEQLKKSQEGLQKAIVIGQLTRDADGKVQMEVEHVLPDNGIAADPTFSHSGIFTLVGLGREQGVRAV